VYCGSARLLRSSENLATEKLSADEAAWSIDSYCMACIVQPRISGGGFTRRTRQVVIYILSTRE